MRTHLYDRRIAVSQARIVKFLPLHLNCSSPKTETSWKFCLSKTEANLDAGFRKIMARKKNAGLSSNGDALWMTALSGTSTLSKKRSASVGSTARPKKRDSERRSVLHHVAKKSVWSELNKERCRRMEKLGKMTDAGRAVLSDMSEKGFVMDADVLAALQADKKAWHYFLTFPVLYQRIRIDTVQIKKKNPKVFRFRLQKLIENSRNGVMYGEWNDNGRLSY